MTSFRVAAVQAGAAAFDKERSLAKALERSGDAAAAGARLIVFPEAFLGGYPKGADFGARVGSRSPEGRVWFRRYWEGAVEVPGAETRELAALTARLGVHLVIGAIERDGATLYCTALFFGPEGYLGKHRKLVPTGMERLIWGSGDGSTLVAFDTPGGRIGAAICWENYMPLLRAAMYAQGVRIYCAPTVDDRDSWLPTIRHIAAEGRCHVISACQFARREDYPGDYPAAATAGILIRGGSAIADPFGNLLAGPVFDEERILLADIDPGRVAEGKFDLDVCGHYARPDVFRLAVDRTPRRTVQFFEEPDEDAV